MGKKCIIIGAGDFQISSISVEEGDWVIAADGGFSYCRRLKLEPDLVLGDFDSLTGEGRQELESLRLSCPEKVKTLPVEKDDTDMLAAIREGLARGYRLFHIYGSQGGRLDHTIANIQCLNFLKEQGAEGMLLEEDGMICLLRDETAEFPPQCEGRLSLFSYGESAEGVDIRNMKYELKDAVLTNSFPIGVSNEFIGRPASVSVRKGTLLLLIHWGKP